VKEGHDYEILEEFIEEVVGAAKLAMSYATYINSIREF